MNKKKRYNELRKSLSRVGYVLHGTITKRVIEREGRKFGPYYQWTFAKNGKTVTYNLSEEQEEEFSKAIQNLKEIKKTLKEMEKLSLEILEETTKGVKKRKKRSLS